MTIRRFVVPATVDSEGDAEVFSPVLSGKLVSFTYVKPLAGGYEDGVDFVLTSEATAATLWAEDDVNASATRYPRAPTHGTDGVAAAFGSEGGGDILDMIALSQDRVKIVIDDGAASEGGGETGTFHITVDS